MTNDKDIAKDVAKEPIKTTSNAERLLEKLLAYEPEGGPFVSVYLDARVDQNGKRNLLPIVRKQLNERAKTYDNQTSEQENFAKDAARIINYLESGVPTTAQGLAIFACSFLTGRTFIRWRASSISTAVLPSCSPTPIARASSSSQPAGPSRNRRSKT